MTELPKNFPEFSIMYKTLSKQIKTLENTMDIVDEKQKAENMLKIKNYKSEILKIKKMFPENFFEELN